MLRLSKSTRMYSNSIEREGASSLTVPALARFRIIS